MDHIELYARLFQHGLGFPELQRLKHQVLIFKTLTKENITEEDMKYAMGGTNKPKMNQLIPALIHIGFTPKQLEKIFNTTQSNISHAKNNQAKRGYSNFVFSRIIDGVYKQRIGKQIRYPRGYKSHQVYEEY